MSIAFISLACMYILVFGAYVSLQCAFLISWMHTPEKKTGQAAKVRISIILPVRNEETQIRNCLDSIASQDYPAELFELIVVDDSSTDQTAAIVKEAIASRLIGNMNYLFLPEDNLVRAHKKRALSAGIRISSGELIVTTDGDCVAGKKWLSSLADSYADGKPSIILGPVAFHREKGLFEKMQSLEFSGLMVVTGASAAMGMPLMCNGANLAYSKTVFESVKGYEGDEEASGDDVLLLKRVNQKYPGSVRFLKLKDALVFTEAMDSPRAFLEQRKRWASKFEKYGQGFMQSTAALVFLCNLFFLAGIAFSVFVPRFSGLYLILAAAKLIIDFLILFLATSFTDKKKLLWIYLPELIFYSLYVVLAALLGLRKSYEWKGRRI